MNYKTCRARDKNSHDFVSVANSRLIGDTHFDFFSKSSAVSTLVKALPLQAANGSSVAPVERRGYGGAGESADSSPIYSMTDKPENDHAGDRAEPTFGTKPARPNRLIRGRQPK